MKNETQQMGEKILYFGIDKIIKEIVSKKDITKEEIVNFLYQCRDSFKSSIE